MLIPLILVLSFDNPSVFIPNKALPTTKFSHYNGNPREVSILVSDTALLLIVPVTVKAGLVFVTS